MPRFEVADGESRKFWEIQLGDRTLTLRWGPIGSAGQTRQKTFDSPEEARREAERAIAEKTRKGYRLVDGVPPPRPETGDVPLLRNPELEARVIADPDDEAALLVYGDWLQAHGDPRGELIAVHAAMRRESDPTRFLPYKKRAEEILALHQVRLLGRELADALPSIRIEWHAGFLRSAKMFGSLALDVLLASPSAVFLRELEVNERPAQHPRSVDATLASLAAGPATLSTLRIEAQGEASLDPLCTAFPRLRRLSVAECDVALERPDFPRLAKLDLSGAHLEDATLAAIGGSRWPALKTLVLPVPASADAGGFVAMEAPELSEAAFFHGGRAGLAMVQALPGTPLLARLEKLRLEGLTESALHALARNAAAFRHLRELMVGIRGVPARAVEEALRDARIPGLRTWRSGP